MEKHARKPARGLVAYILTAYPPAYATEYVAASLLYRGSSLTSVIGAQLILAATMWLPTLGTVAGLAAEGIPPGRGLRSLLHGWRLNWYLAAPVFVLAAYAAALAAAMALGYPVGLRVCQPDMPSALVIAMLAAGVAAGLTINAAVALGEEIGWRGYLLDLLAGRLGEPVAALVIGVMWGLWHLPLVYMGYNYILPIQCGTGARGLPAVAAFTVFTVAASLLLVGLRLHGSVAAAAAGHGVINGVAGAFALMVRGPRLVAPPAGAAASLGFLAASLPLWLPRGRGGRG